MVTKNKNCSDQSKNLLLVVALLNKGKTMKTLIIFFASIFCVNSVLFSQGFLPSDIGYNMDRIVSSSMSSQSEEAAVINANGDFIYKQSLANINNEKAYEMSLKNQSLRAKVYFEKRQTNLYYRSLETFQKRRISEMKREKYFSKEEFDSLFGM